MNEPSYQGCELTLILFISTQSNHIDIVHLELKANNMYLVRLGHYICYIT